MTVSDDFYELTRDGITYSLDIESEVEIEAWRTRGDWDNPPECEINVTDSYITDYRVYDDRLGTAENDWNCEVKDFELTKEEEKAVLDYLEEKAVEEYQFD